METEYLLIVAKKTREYLPTNLKAIVVTHLTHSIEDIYDSI